MTTVTNSTKTGAYTISVTRNRKMRASTHERIFRTEPICTEWKARDVFNQLRKTFPADEHYSIWVTEVQTTAINHDWSGL